MSIYRKQLKWNDRQKVITFDREEDESNWKMCSSERVSVGDELRNARAMPAQSPEITCSEKNFIGQGKDDLPAYTSVTQGRAAGPVHDLTSSAIVRAKSCLPYNTSVG